MAKGSYWVKLYIELLDKPKIAMLPDNLWRRVIELFLLAGRYGGSGNIPAVEELSFVLRVPADVLLQELIKIASIGVIEQTASGWFVVNFAEYQSPPPALRMRQSRLKAADAVADFEKAGYNLVTDCNANVTQIDRKKERLTEAEEDIKSEGTAQQSTAIASGFDEFWGNLVDYVSSSPGFPRQVSSRLRSAKPIAYIVETDTLLIKSDDADWLNGHMIATLEKALPAFPGYGHDGTKVQFVGGV